MTEVVLPTPTPGASGEHAFHTATKQFIDEAGADGAQLIRGDDETIARTDVENTFTEPQTLGGGLANKPTVSGANDTSETSNLALRSLLDALDALGIINDTTTDPL